MSILNKGRLRLSDVAIRQSGNDWPVASLTTEILDDISTLFDGDKNVFPLTINQSNVSLVINNIVIDSKDVDVSLDGITSRPYVTKLPYPWITDYDSHNGYRIVNNTIIFYTAPNPGTQCTMVLRNTSTITASQRQYPYTASIVALGD
jgi:hypothetical protein